MKHFVFKVREVLLGVAATFKLLFLVCQCHSHSISTTKTTVNMVVYSQGTSSSTVAASNTASKLNKPELNF